MNLNFRELERRDQLAVILAGVCLALFVLYQFIWSPFDSKLLKMQKDIIYQQNLLTWMKEAKNSLSHQTKQGHLNAETLLSRTTLSLKRAKLNSFPYELQQADGEKISLAFKHVPYVLYMDWMEHYWKQYALSLQSADIKPLKAPGTVKTLIIFGVK